MNVLSLFDGLSGGSISLERAGVTVDNYYASEIDKYAMSVSHYNYPNIKQLGSVVDINTNDLPEIDLLIGGSPCFVKGTKVITNIDYKNIEDIIVGDCVLTHTNTYQKVLDVGNTQSPIVEVHAQGMKPTRTTKDHPYYVRKMSRKWDNKNKITKRVFSEPMWVHAKSLKKDDFIGTPINNLDSNPLMLTEEECYIIGRYIADGHTIKDYEHYQLILSIDNHKIHQIEDYIKTLSYTKYNHTKSVNHVVFINMRLVEIVEEHCGICESNKHFSSTLVNLPKDLLRIVLQGYLDGDGHLNDNGVYKVNSISENLILTISQVVSKCYNTTSSYLYTKTIIEGSDVNHTYSSEFRTDMKKQSNDIVIDGIIWTRFKKTVTTTDTETVWNMEVEKDNSYTANNFIVHNCQSFSFAGKRNGMTTIDEMQILDLEHYLELKSQNFEFEGQSYLFWEYMRVLKALKPKYFLLENVVMTKKWEMVLSNAIGCLPIKINSSLLSAQNRNRLYWTNIPWITQPIDKGILLGDILEKDVDSKYFITESKYKLLERNGVYPKGNLDKSGCCVASFWKQGKQECLSLIDVNHKPYALTERRTEESKEIRKEHKRLYGKDFSPRRGKELQKREDDKMNCLTATFTQNEHSLVDDNKVFRRLTPLEYERLQTLPHNYTKMGDDGEVSDSQRYKMIGNGWTIDVIVHLFKGLDPDYSVEKMEDW